MISFWMLKTYVIKAWTWVRENAVWLLLLFMGAAAGRSLLKRKDSDVATLKDALAVEQHKSAIENLKGRREEALKAVSASAERDEHLGLQQAQLEMQIAQHKRELVAIHQKTPDVHALTDEEVEERFRHAGL